jgi:hypothetical protein
LQAAQGGQSNPRGARSRETGRIDRGFDFLGYHFGPAGLAVAKKTIVNFIDKASRLYEQKRRAVSAASPLEIYIRRWLRWAASGLNANDGNEISTAGCVKITSIAVPWSSDTPAGSRIYRCGIRRWCEGGGNRVDGNPIGKYDR